MTPAIDIGARTISAENSCYIIAEAGVNHNGDASIAHKLIDAAVEAGADAVKFQTYVTDELVIPDAKQAKYQLKNTGSEVLQAKMLRQYELPFEVFLELRNHCDEAGIDFISTAFDSKSLDYIISLKPACLKWPSGELTNLPMLLQAARSGLPLILSTGMGSLAEVAKAVEWLDGNVPLAILQCVSDYPAKIEDQNLNTIQSMRSVFGCPTGFSDHTPEIYSAIAARALGMAILEKHLTLDKSMPGPDHQSSIETDEFLKLVQVMRAIEVGLGDGIKRPARSETNIRAVARKSLVYNNNLSKGHLLSAEDLTTKRPGTGMAPEKIDQVIGRKLVKQVSLNQLVDPSHVG